MIIICVFNKANLRVRINLRKFEKKELEFLEKTQTTQKALNIEVFFISCPTFHIIPFNSHQMLCAENLHKITRTYSRVNTLMRVNWKKQSLGIQNLPCRKENRRIFLQDMQYFFLCNILQQYIALLRYSHSEKVRENEKQAALFVTFTNTYFLHIRKKVSKKYKKTRPL